MCASEFSLAFETDLEFRTKVISTIAQGALAAESVQAALRCNRCGGQVSDRLARAYREHYGVVLGSQAPKLIR